MTLSLAPAPAPHGSTAESPLTPIGLRPPGQAAPLVPTPVLAATRVAPGPAGDYPGGSTHHHHLNTPAVRTGAESQWLPPGAAPLSQGPLDPWANAYITYTHGYCSGEGYGPGAVVGPNDNLHYSMGWGVDAYIVVDMGAGEEALCNGPGTDVKVYELGPGGEDYRVWVSNSPDGPWTYVWRGDFTEEFELPTSVDSVRYVKFTVPEDVSDCETNPGPDIDAVQALHMCAPTPLPPEITEPEDGSSLGGTVNPGSITVGGTAGSQVTVEVYVDDVLSGGTTSTFGGTWSTTINVLDGVHSIYAKAKRGTLESDPSGAITLTYDASPPSTTISAPAADGDWVSGTYTFTGQTSDLTAVSAISYTIDDGAWSYLGSGPDWSVGYDTTALSTGSGHHFTVRALDSWCPFPSSNRS